MSEAADILADSFGWDVVNWSRSASVWSQALPDDLGGMRALEVGCGALNGGLSLWLASKGAAVTASSNFDCGSEMAVFQERHDLAGSVEFQVIDVADIPEPASYDIVCWKSMLGGIGRDGTLDAQRQALQSIVAALKPGGWVIFVENLSATRLHMALRRRWGAGRNQWRYFAPAELRELITSVGLSDIRFGSTGFLGAFGRSEAQKRVLGHIDGLLCPLLPPSWHYIAYGAARKSADIGDSLQS